MMDKIFLRSSKRIPPVDMTESHPVDGNELPRDIRSQVGGIEEADIRSCRVVGSPNGWKMYVMETMEGKEAVSNILTNVYLCDYSKDVFAGYTKVGIAEYGLEEKKKMAYVRGTKTVGEGESGRSFRSLGLGTRRLLAANTYCQEHFGVPLSSGTIVDPSAQGIWERLVGEGIAEPVNESKMGAFRFKV